MAEIVKQLNLNRHPRDCNDYSLIEATNVQLTKDKHSITSEYSIEDNYDITTAISQKFSDYKIVGHIDCPTELILFVYGTPVGEDYEDSAIFRYNEAAADCSFVTNKWQWSGGRIKGTYTYNVHNNLIIAVAEYDLLHDEDRAKFEHNGDVPLKIINIDTCATDNFYRNPVSYAAVPEVPYAYCHKFDYVKGYSYKGYYEFYIRYKISDNNYTQWYYINGKPIVDETALKDVMSYMRGEIIENFEATEDAVHNTDTSALYEDYKLLTNGHYDFVSSPEDMCGIALKLHFNFIPNNASINYREFQLAYVVQSKDYTKCFRTTDLSYVLREYTVNPKSELEYSPEEVVMTYYNYYNVKQITSYQNRIYIADYKEHSPNLTAEDLDYDIDSVKVGCQPFNINNTVDFNDKTIQDDLLKNSLIPGEIYDFYIHFVDKYGHPTAGIRLNSRSDKNNYNGAYITAVCGEWACFQVKLADTPLGMSRPTLILNSIPDGYIAAFLSYKKFQKINKLTGLYYDGDNSETNVGSKFANGVINYADKVDAGVDKAVNFYGTSIENEIVGAKYRFCRNDNPLVFRTNTEWANTVNSTLVSNTEDIDVEIAHEIVVANAAVNNNAGRESYLWIKNLLNTSHTPKIITLKTSKLPDYSVGKTLVPTSLIAFMDDSGPQTVTQNFDNGTGYNGFLAFDSVIIYHKYGFVLNSVDGHIYNASGSKTITKPETGETSAKPYMCYIFPYVWDYPLHVRRFKNEPKVSIFVSEKLTNVKHLIQTIVEPKDSIDLFEYPHPNKSDIGSYKLIEAYDEDIPNVTEYQKTLRRSNVIQDETEEIGWRRFPLEGYKNIIENKGIITNIFALGTSFFVHTKHSLFLFDIDNTIKADNENILLYQPDIFNCQYKEVFTSDKGYGGLQDDLAYCIGEFGYIFYNTDFARLYRLDNGGLVPIDTAISNWIPDTSNIECRFAADRTNQRLLINFSDMDNKSRVLSYDYTLNSFISWHDYNFIEAAHTKVRPYLLYNRRKNFGNYNTVRRGSYVNYVDSKYGKATHDSNNNISNFSISIIVNSAYEAIKMLEFIKYDCRRIIEQNPVEDDDNSKRIFPYSGSSLRIYNEDCDTNEMDISVELDNPKYNRFNNYKKPWYELTKWNYNYFRDKISTHPTTNISDKLRRIHGNYLIFNFKFNNTDTKDLRFEFESLECQFTNNR